jgi:1,5-anhydro-D-fructose reductase (1,5-anhydro-D-mannitol-forming)
VKVGILSFAHPHAFGYARLLGGYPDVELRVADPDRDLSGLGVPWSASYAELMDWGPDAVVVTSENARHRPLVELAASRGAHILCEKPLATSWADGLAIARATAAAGVQLMMAYPVRFASAFAQLRADYAAGVLGQLVTIRGTNNGKLPAGWFADPALAGGGALADHVVHVADLIEALTQAQPVSVSAVSNRILHADRARAETAGLVLVTYADGLSAAIDCSWSRPDTAPTWGGLTLSVAGTAGTADLDFFGARGRGLDAATGRPIELPYGPDYDAALLAAFLAAVRSGARPDPGLQSGLRTLAIMLAAQESARRNLTVSLAEAFPAE